MLKRIYGCHFGLLLFVLCCPNRVIAQQQRPVIAFTSDTQAPLAIENVIRKLDHNQEATEMIFKDILAQKPSALFILGDVVSLGYDDAKWRSIDTYLKWYADIHIPVYAALGNHELMMNADKGNSNFQARFPAHNFTGYSEVIDSVAVVLLNSNFGKMTKTEIATQDDWYKQELKKMDDNPAIKLIIVGCHHSPFTNSKVVKPSLEVQRNFIPAFISSKKGILFLSGHSHNFEQFEVQGKCFLVIGGGGGPHQPLNLDKPSTRDLSVNYKPMFHYLEVTRDHDSLYLVSRRLKTDFSGFDDGWTFSVSK